MLFGLGKKKEPQKPKIFDNVHDYLPIGSVVHVKKTDKRLMIFGIIQSDQKVNDGKTYDYITVPYPEGNMGLDYQYLINADDIESVVFRGYEDQEREEFLERLNTELEKYRDEGSSN